MALNARFLQRLLSTAVDVLRAAGHTDRVPGRTAERVRNRASGRKAGPGRAPDLKPGRAPDLKPGRTPGAPPAPGLSGPYPGDFSGSAVPAYSPDPDGSPDPGEIVWTWVPYEEDPTRGKDRPVLLIGRNGSYLLGAMLTSRNHTTEQRPDPDYIDIGTGSWDRQGRPSEVKLDRVLQIRPGDIRREGAILERQQFERVARRLRAAHGWK